MNRNEIIQVCSKELSLLRAKAQNEAYQNLIQARKYPEYLNLEKEERKLTFDLGKLKAYKQDCTKHEKELNLVLQEKEKILKSIGLTSEDLSPKYHCNKCQDIGYIREKMCSCLSNRIHQYIIKNSGLGKTNLSSFDEFDVAIASQDEHKTQLLKLKKKFEMILETYPLDSPKFITLIGKTGVGKTFITECFTNEIIKKGYVASFISSFGMNNLFTSYHTTFDNQKATYLNTLIDPDVLVIDDLGTEPVLRNVTKEYLYLILSERSRLNKLTIITTNLEPQELLARYNERIFSRLFNKRESLLTQIVGSDLRINKK